MLTRATVMSHLSAPQVPAATRPFWRARRGCDKHGDLACACAVRPLHPSPNRHAAAPAPLHGPRAAGGQCHPFVARDASHHYHRHMPDSISPRLRPEPPTPTVLADIVNRALLEDLAGGDITSDATVGHEVRALGVA